MKKYQLTILGTIILVIGILIGWLVIPKGNANMSDHSEHQNTVTEEGIKSNDMSGSTAVAEIWTCSMHPQIRLDEPGLCPICEMDLIPLDQTMGSDDPTVLRMSKESAKLAQVETTLVGGASSDNNSSETANTIEVDGTIELDERSIRSQSSHIPGRVERMFVNFEGEYVSAGQRIAQIYSTEVLAASEELLIAAKFDGRVEGLKDASIQKLKNWKINEVQINQILETGKPIETIDIYADHSGFVLDKKISQGDYVKQGQSLYTLGSTARLWLILNVFESNMANVHKGQKITFITPSFPNKKFEATITYIDPLMNAQTRTSSVRAEIVNTGNKLKPGMLIDAEIMATSKIDQKNRPLFVPSSAILWTGDKSVVYVQLPDMEVPSYQFREVELGQQSNGMTMVLSGLEVGEEIVTHGAFAIDAAAQLNNNASMMNRDILVKSSGGESIPNFQESTPDKFKLQLRAVVTEYLSLKDQFVATDGSKAIEAAQNFLSALEQVDMMLLKGEEHNFWMLQSNAMKDHGKLITESDDVENQRKQFDFLSQALITSISAFGVSEGALYVQHCPMAFDNKGADWLSNKEQIQNPYFGDKMMKCGSVVKEIGVGN